MSFQKSLKDASAAASELGTKEARVLFASANDPQAVLFPLNECVCAALRASPIRQYGRGIAKHPAMVSTNLGHWHDGVAHWGEMQWYVNQKLGKLFAWDGKSKLSENARPEGYLQDLHETDRAKEVCFKPNNSFHQTIIDWVNEMVAKNAATRSGSLYPEVVTPRLCVPIPTSTKAKNWLILRQGNDLDFRVDAGDSHQIAIKLPVLALAAALRLLVAEDVGDGEPAEGELERPTLGRHHAGECGCHLWAQGYLAVSTVCKSEDLFVYYFLIAFCSVEFCGFEE